MFTQRQPASVASITGRASPIDTPQPLEIPALCRQHDRDVGRAWIRAKNLAEVLCFDQRALLVVEDQIRMPKHRHLERFAAIGRVSDLVSPLPQRAG